MRGVYPVFQTPFHDDESIDWKTLERELDWLFECRADGIVMAMVSEVLRLATDEREQMAEFVCGRATGRGPVVISVCAESGAVSERLARHAESVGAAAVMAIPPFAVPLDEDELRCYYTRILKAVSLPVIVQDASAYVGRPLSIEFQARLNDEFGERAYFKPEAKPLGPNLAALRRATAGRARVFEGSGGIALLECHPHGLVGTMPAADLIDAMVVLWDALEAGNRDLAERLSTPLCQLVSLQTSLDAFLAIEKYLLQRRGVFVNTVVRGPVGYQLDEATQNEVDRRFETLQRVLAEIGMGAKT